MAMADYCLCDKCGGKAFYDANINDPRYVATYDPQEAKDTDPIDITVLCSECAKSDTTTVLTPAELATLRRLRAGELVAVEAGFMDDPAQFVSEIRSRAGGPNATLRRMYQEYVSRRAAPPAAKEEGNG